MPLDLFRFTGLRDQEGKTVVLRDGQRLEDVCPMVRAFSEYPRWSWGEMGRGTYQLALCLLLQCVREDLAITLAGPFSSNVVCLWEKAGFSVTRSEILEWVAEWVKGCELETFGQRG